MRSTGSAFDTRVTFEGFTNIPQMAFNKKAMRKAYRDAGRVIQRDAKKRISYKRAIYDYPAKRKGGLHKSLIVKMSRSGMTAIVQHKTIPGSKYFYPAFLHYGTKRGLKPRGNYILDALEDRRSDAISIVKKGLLEALA